MPKQTLKIMSWNVEKLSIIQRFNYQKVDRTADCFVTLYISDLIKNVNPDIVCFLELDIRTRDFVVHFLKIALGSQWAFYVSNGVHGGEPIGRDKNNKPIIDDSECYLVCYKQTNDKQASNCITLDILSQGTGLIKDFGSKEVFKRALLKLHVLTSGKHDFYIYLVHLDKSDFKLFAKFAKTVGGPNVAFFVGDLNTKPAKVKTELSSEPKFQDIYTSMNVSKALLSSSTFKFFDKVMKKPPLTSEGFRDEENGIDNIICLSNGNLAQKTNNNPDNNPNTGIIDVVLDYQMGSMSNSDLLPLRIGYLESIPANDLIRQAPGNNKSQDYGSIIINPPKQKPDYFLNGWARYLGGISDHLPVVMTIDIG